MLYNSHDFQSLKTIYNLQTTKNIIWPRTASTGYQLHYDKDGVEQYERKSQVLRRVNEAYNLSLERLRLAPREFWEAPSSRGKEPVLIEYRQRVCKKQKALK